ncbi:4Fe-4S dicluster domain-containing protein [Oceanidesulfovibrio marinus]|uniref:Heterodisulfide reductase subunit C n=1 Tax=Oceanidesulfovibrio marinus TaxID=370038 RepID=A0A6P1ZB23_9BACT|nr:4Fe-4S dicluster domain-containing protein [Oceanidesulfovibrio marinus]TVM30068.1 heterodisulfide reductase subunit C [Oceanidesulfovibrio marinus]
MEVINITKSYDPDFGAEVEAESEQNVRLCYQCGNCTAGCPYTFAYDIPVSQIMRLVQAGQKEKVLSCRSIWICATCESCTTRCPNDIDVARLMDVLRHMARRYNYNAVPTVRTFVDSFLNSVEKHGRVFEMGLMAAYMTKTGRFWTDTDLSPKVLPKGKLSFKPHRIQGRDEVAKIFERYKEQQR